MTKDIYQCSIQNFFNKRRKKKKQVLDHWPMLKITFEALSTLWRGKLLCLEKNILRGPTLKE